MTVPFADQLRRCRHQAGLSQSRLAVAAGVSVRTVRNLEHGRTRPRPDSARLLADALGLAGPDREAFVQAGGGIRELPCPWARTLPGCSALHRLLEDTPWR